MLDNPSLPDGPYRACTAILPTILTMKHIISSAQERMEGIFSLVQVQSFIHSHGSTYKLYVLIFQQSLSSITSTTLVSKPHPLSLLACQNPTRLPCWLDHGHCHKPPAQPPQDSWSKLSDSCHHVISEGGPLCSPYLTVKVPNPAWS